MSDKPPSSQHFTVSALDQLSLSLRSSKDFNSSGPLKSMDPGRAGAFASTPGSTGQRNAVRLASGGFRVSTQSAHPNIVFGYDNPSVRFGDRTRASSRPVSKEGATSFHFAHSYMSKTSPIQNLIREFNGGRGHFNSKAGDHLEYIERDGAAEELGKRRRYDGLDEFLDNFEAMKEAVADRSAQEQQDYLERAGAAEKMQLRNITDDEIDALETASFGTIGRSIEERHHFWKEVEKLEADPRGDKVKLAIDHDQKFWDLALANRKTAPEPLKTQLELKHNDPAPDFVVLNQVATPKAFAIYKWAIGLDQDFPIEIEPGRGGRIQNRIIAELPHELDPHERVRIVRDFTSKLTEKGLPFWAVIHAPDENNDKRNYHVHIVYYDRPAAKMADPSDPTKLVWDFEVQDVIKYQSRNTRITRPYAQNKLREANDQKWIKELREYWEAVSNTGMRDAGLSKRYDARTYKEMGIDLEPLKHIPSKTFNKERKGDLTPEGVSLARRQWDVLLENVVANNYRRTSLRRRNIAQNAERIERLLARTNPNKPLATRQVQRIAKIADKYAVLIGLAELSQDVTRVIIDRVASRARLVFHAAFGSSDKKPRGRPRKTPLGLAGPSKALTPEAEEARLFLKTILPEGKRLDDRNRSELHQVRQGLALMSRRLEDLERNPTQNPNDPRQPTYIDLDRIDPSPEEMTRRREEAVERVKESVMALAERNLTEALKNAADEAEAARPAQSTETKPAEAKQPEAPASAEPQPQSKPEPAPRVPASGPGSRPAYLDEKNPKGTRYRYEPFSIRPDRPQKGSKPAPDAQARPEPTAAPKRPAESARVQPKPTQAPAAAPAPAASPSPQTAANTEAKINVGNARPDAANSRPQAAVLKPSAETPEQRAPSQSTNRPAEQKPPVQAAKPAPATPAATSPSRTAQEPKPQPKGSFTIPEKPARTTPSRVPGFVVEGAKPKPRTSGHELTPRSSAHPVEKKSAEPSKPAPSDPKQMQLPIANVPFPKKPPAKRGKKKGPDRNDQGPGR